MRSRKGKEQRDETDAHTGEWRSCQHDNPQEQWWKTSKTLITHHTITGQAPLGLLRWGGHVFIMLPYLVLDDAFKNLRAWIRYNIYLLYLPYRLGLHCFLFHCDKLSLFLRSVIVKQRQWPFIINNSREPCTTLLL